MTHYAVRLYNGRFRMLDREPENTITFGDYIVYENEEGVWCNQALKMPTRLVIDRSEMDPVHYVRIATESDMKQVKEKRERERQAYLTCRTKILKHGLPMKLSKATYTFDYRRLTFFFSANGRVDFRQLLRDLTRSFNRTRIMLRQIGLRHETGLMGGVGSCGKPLCCSTFLDKFETISLQIALDQDLPPNPARLSGNCGRLKCCLRYEQDYYLFMKEKMPEIGKTVRNGNDKGRVISHLILKNSVEVLMEGKRLIWPINDIETIN